MKRGIFITCLVVSLSIFLTVHVMAQGGRTSTGNLKVFPSFTVQELYDDNIYLGNGTNNTTEIIESDWITHLMPSFGFNYSLQERGGVSLGYEGDIAYYSDDDDNDWQTNKGMFNLDYQAPGGLRIGINSIYTDAEDPYGSLQQYRTGLKTERWNNDLKSEIGYYFGNRLTIIAFYNFYKQDYDLERDYTQDHDINEFGAGFQMRLLPKTRGFVRYHFGERDYFSHPAGTASNETNDSNFDWRRVNAGLSWDTTARMVGELNFGYQWKYYDNEFDASTPPRRYEDKDTWIASTQVAFRATATKTLALSITRALREAGSSTNEYFEDTGIGINLQQVILIKITLTVGGVYSQNNYNLPVNKPREDDNYKANIGLEYRIQDRLRAGIGYRYMKKDSNDEENDYTDNQLMISLSAVN